MQFEEYRHALAALQFGKRLPTAIYVFRDGTTDLGPRLNDLLKTLKAQYELGDEFNVVKFRTDELKVSFLRYPGFLEEAHPALNHAVTIDLVNGRVRRTNYRDNHNPPILHRKESFLPQQHPKRKEFEDLTRAEESVGLYAQPETIGFKLNWEQLLGKLGLKIEGHRIEKLGTEEARGESGKLKPFEEHVGEDQVVSYVGSPRDAFSIDSNRSRTACSGSLKTCPGLPTPTATSRKFSVFSFLCAFSQ